jgi:hypothetical protein
MARKRPVIDLETYSALDAYAIALNEYYKSLRKGCFQIVNPSLIGLSLTYPIASTISPMRTMRIK